MKKYGLEILQLASFWLLIGSFYSSSLKPSTWTENTRLVIIIFFVFSVVTLIMFNTKPFKD